MKTYLKVWFNSEGKPTNEITERLLSMGFRSLHGNYDYVYDWAKNASVDDAIAMGDDVHETLAGCNAVFKLETI
jgi:hypothetical protein